MQQNNKKHCDMQVKKEAFYQVSQYPAFAYNTPGVRKDSYEKSIEEEISLISKLVDDISTKKPLSSNVSVWHCFNNQVNSVIQGFQRPMCGLVALHMAAQMLKRLQPTTSELSVLEIFNKAIDLKISKQGEMFSVYEMANLASILYSCKAEVLEGNLCENQQLLLRYLLQGQPLLVPYDNDRNFEPCLQSGHKAHWTVLTGAVIQCSSSFISNEPSEEFHGIPRVFHISDRNRLKFAEIVTEQIDKISEVYFFVKQGKSAKNRLWSLKSLSQSNGNLMERDPSIDWTQYHCPYSLKETLREKCVVLHA